jgi:hypothetical protein
MFSARSGNGQCSIGECSVLIQGMFSARAGNGQCSIGECLVLIRGMFSARSGNVQCSFRLSCSGRPWPLQETIQESTKVDAEYNLPTWVAMARVHVTYPRSSPPCSPRVTTCPAQCLPPTNIMINSRSGNV